MTLRRLVIYVSIMDQEKRKEILEKGLSLILKRGYYGTGIQEIADAAGIPKGSFYNYFKSKEQFAIDLLDYSVRGLVEQLEDALTDDAIPAIQRLERLHKGVAYRYIRDQFMSFGYLASMLSLEMAHTNGPVIAAVDQAFVRMKEALRRILQEAKDAGHVRASLHVEKLAEFIQNAWYGALIRTRASGTIIPLDIFYDISMELLQVR